MAHGDVEWYTRLAWRARDALARAAGARRARASGSRSASRGSRSAPTASRRSASRERSSGSAIPCEWLSPERRARALSRRSASTTSHGVLYEPDAGVLHARRATQLLVEDAAAGRGVEVGTRDAPPTTAAGGRRRLGVRRLAAGALPAARRPADLAPRRLLLRRRRRRGAARRASATTTPAFYGHGDARRARRQGRAGRAGRRDRPGHARARCPIAATERARARVHGAALPVARRRADRRRARLPVRPDRRHAFPLRAATPSAAAWWLLGGGSGHGFKHGPALGEYVADCIEGRREPEPFHGARPRAPATPACARHALVLERFRPSRASNASISLRSSAFSSYCSSFVSAEAKNASLRPCTSAASSHAARPRGVSSTTRRAGRRDRGRRRTSPCCLEPVEPARHRAARELEVARELAGRARGRRVASRERREHLPVLRASGRSSTSVSFMRVAGSARLMPPIRSTIPSTSRSRSVTRARRAASRKRSMWSSLVGACGTV